MNSKATLIYPHQLFKKHIKNKKAFIIEDPLFFKQYSFHKKKLTFHRASMKYYQKFLEDKGVDVTYVNSKEIHSSKNITSILKKHNISNVSFYDLDDNWLEKRVSSSLKKSKIYYEKLNSPGFVTPLDWSKDFFSNKKNYFQTSFYIAQRKRLSILVDKQLQPKGGSWTYDGENRKKLPKNIQIPKIKWPNKNKFYDEATNYVETNFPSNPGKISGVIYPFTHSLANKALQDFIAKRIKSYGDYQDAISSEEAFIFHSLLSAPLNVGLINPSEIINYALDKHSNSEIPLNSLEGFIRQIIGWREYFRAIYDLESVNQRTKNHFGFKRKIPDSFWNATTGIEPIDNVITKVLENSYSHHIERLMVLGNFMLLCEFDPDEVYRWFMELFIDAYDWVMVPNVYGMSQYSDGGLITTKPYVSSSNYIRKMSNFKSGEWSEIWDALYWNFLHSHRKLFEGNNRMSLMYRQLDKMTDEKLKNHKKIAKKYLNSLDA